MQLATLRLKKNEDRRIRAGHIWVYSNEIDTAVSPIKSFKAGQEVLIEAADKKILGVAYINPQSLITARIFTRRAHERLDLAFFIKKIKSALSLRQHLYSKPYYRLVFGDSDNLPGLVIDRFDTVFSIQLNTTGMELKKSIIVDALREAIPETTSVLFRNDSQSRQHEGLENYVEAGFGTPPQDISVEENDTVFTAPLWTGQKTGWFYDHRLNRSRLKDYANNQRVLDVFSYLGAWGIQAATLGAKEVVCVDSSPLSADIIPKNAALNHVEDKVRVICDDAFVALKKLADAEEQFSLIILDPPAFIKKQKDIKEGLIAYQRINELALKLLAPGGILISCSCSMQIDDKEFMQMIRKAGIKTRANLHVLERGHQAPDHPVHIAIPETDYLKMVIARKTAS
jgi:23S rRNA (cytosine1962-C5)-methyltransferase